MAIRVNASTEYLDRTSNVLDANGTYTIMGWFYLENLTVYGHLFDLNAGDSENHDAIYTYNDGGGYDFYLSANIGGYLTDIATTTPPSTSQWFHIALVRASDTNLKVYIDGADEATNTNDVNGRSSITKNKIGVSIDNENIDGRIAGLKAWSTALTQNEILQELRILRPVRTANLYCFCPVFPGSGERGRDYSGNGYDWTENGTLTDESPPPVSWGALPVYQPLISAAAGGVEEKLLQPILIRSNQIPIHQLQL